MMMFTRLPLWRLHQPREEAFRKAEGYWPFAGWLTGGAMMFVFWLGLSVFNLPIVALLVVGVRILLTGAFHEDGLADFADGMGGGRSRAHTLSIMKDSHIGTYGVLALVVYLILFYFCIRELTMAVGMMSLRADCPCKNPILMMSAFMLTADVWGKCCASMLVGQLPYARGEAEAKAGLVYAPIDWGWHLLRVIVSLVPVAALWWHIGMVPHYQVLVVPFVVEVLMASWMRLRLRGYTGDCCGATFLLCELSMYLTWIAVLP